MYVCACTPEWSTILIFRKKNLPYKWPLEGRKGGGKVHVHVCILQGDIDCVYYTLHRVAREGAVPVVRALHDFSARNPDELSISAGDELEVSVIIMYMYKYVINNLMYTCIHVHM